jgi:hypothetical protein
MRVMHAAPTGFEPVSEGVIIRAPDYRAGSVPDLP